MNSKNKHAKAFDEIYVDEHGTAWRQPTAWAYAQVCKARDLWRTRAIEFGYVEPTTDPNQGALPLCPSDGGPANREDYMAGYQPLQSGQPVRFYPCILCSIPANCKLFGCTFEAVG